VSFISNNRRKFVSQVYSAVAGRLAVAQLAAIEALEDPTAIAAAWEQITAACRLVLSYELTIAKAAWEPVAEKASAQFATLKAAGPVAREVGDAIWRPANHLKEAVKASEARLERFEAELKALVDAEPALQARLEKKAARTGTEG
jgi:chaperonin cofactor prefoldin